MSSPNTRSPNPHQPRWATVFLAVMNVFSTLALSPTTPQDSIAILPPTLLSSENSTTSVNYILYDIRGRRDGCYSLTDPWRSFGVTPSQYKDLLRVLHKDDSLQLFVDHKLRYDYFPSAQQFVLRMPTYVHELFLSDVVAEILGQLRSIARSGSPRAAFAQDVRHGGSASIKFGDTVYGKHDPDALFKHRRAQYPGVVIEVSYSQKRRDLPRLADDYILGSNGSIRVVVGLNIEYRGKKATLSIWRPQAHINDDGTEVLEAEPSVIDQVICDEDGAPNPDSQAGLCLKLEDFAAKAVVKDYQDLRDTVFIPYTDLCAYLQSAEDEALTVEQEQGLADCLRPGRTKRRRESTPPERLRSDHERRFQEDEHQVLKTLIRMRLLLLA